MFDKDAAAYSAMETSGISIVANRRNHNEKIASARASLFDAGIPGDLLRDIDMGMAALSVLCHMLAVRAGWWHDPATGNEKPERNFGELISLFHSELSEALEADRKSLPDSHLPHRDGVTTELVDLLIRVGDFAGKKGLDLGGVMLEKLAYNATRADHTLEARAAANGKKY